MGTELSSREHVSRLVDGLLVNGFLVNGFQRIP